MLLTLTPINIKSGFSCSGIWPYNRNIFSEKEFAPSTVTDRPAETISNKIDNSVSLRTTTLVSQDINKPSTSANPIKCQTSEARQISLPDLPTFQSLTTKKETSTASPSSEITSPEQLRPYTKVDFSKPKTAKSVTGKSAIWTDTPENNILEE